MKDDKIVFCDTGFVIRLLDKTNDLHNNALGYFQYFLEHDYIIRMSTIAVAEFCVKDSIENLPLRNILLSPFNAYHASKSGESAKILYEAKSKGVLEVDVRIIIQNDVNGIFFARQVDSDSGTDIHQDILPLVHRGK